MNNKDIIATSPGGKVILCKFMQITLDNVKVELSNSSSSLTSLNDTTFNNQSGVSAKSTNYVNIFEEVMHDIVSSCWWISLWKSITGFILFVWINIIPLVIIYQSSSKFLLLGQTYQFSRFLSNLFARIICPLRFYFIKHIKFKLKKQR